MHTLWNALVGDNFIVCGLFIPQTSYLGGEGYSNTTLNLVITFFQLIPMIGRGCILSHRHHAVVFTWTTIGGTTNTPPKPCLFPPDANHSVFTYTAEGEVAVRVCVAPLFHLHCHICEKGCCSHCHKMTRYYVSSCLLASERNKPKSHY